MPIRHPLIRCCLLSSFLLGAQKVTLSADDNPHGDVFRNKPVPATVDFNRDVRPVLSAKCYHCHGPDEGSRKAKLRLDLRGEAIKERDGDFVIKPGDAAASSALARILSKDPDEVMPPPKEGHALTSREVEILQKWIDQGAPYAEHWAFLKPVKPPVPATGPGAAIDLFVGEKLKAHGLAPSPEADRHTLVRRLALDLTGLPPTPEEVKGFLEDRSPDAYEKLVDHYLAQSAYGERWARVWLDLARYADSAGYGSDPLRLNIWPYRDWVISALNRNVPYDQFTVEQLAGDLLPDPTPDQLIATAFHRNTMTNTEGGTDDEEFRVAAVKDRINTTMQVWMGLTLVCAQCHTHKFDPITQQEYYEFYAIFNQTQDSDRGDETPVLPLPDPAQQDRMKALEAEIQRLEKRLSDPAPAALSEELAAFEATMKQPTRWEPLAMVGLNSEKGVALRNEPDGSVLADAVESDTHSLEAVVSKGGITGIRLEAIPDARLPGKGPGRSSGGNFVLSEFKLKAARQSGATPKQVRFVRVALPGKNRILHLAEVQVFAGGANVAPAGVASQSSTGFDGPALLAADGNTDGDYAKKSVSHCALQDDPWWEIDLKEEVPVESIVIWNRTDGGTATRTTGLTVTALDAARKEVFRHHQEAAPQPSAALALSGPMEVVFREASADFEQTDHPVAHALDGKDTTGWAIGAEFGKPHAAVFIPSQPVGEPGRPTKLSFRLAQLYGAGHVMGRYRLSVTRDRYPQPALPEKTQFLLSLPAASRNETQNAQLLAWYKGRSRAFQEVRKELAARKTALAAIKPVTVPVMREMEEAKKRETRFLLKGNFLNPAEVVQPALLTSFHPAPKTPDRLAVARWLMSRENPLTARVTVNRLWAQLFGLGLVETEEDFGTQGTLPSHPELLDWLAVEFMDLKWDVKAMLKTIVMSGTYRQASKASAEAAKEDPRNVLVSHYPRRRLDAEQVRDQALALSGLLSRKIGGPSVFPPQPDGLWRAAFNGQRTWETSKGEDRYRRGLYTFWRRTVPYPSMATFDAPSRENVTLRRVPTNTPLQAFVTLNDPAFFEMAQALGQRMFREGGYTPESRIKYGLELCLVRPATNAQIVTLGNLYLQQRAYFGAHPEEAEKLAGPPVKGLEPAQAATWTVIANVLLNLDGVLMKG